MPSVSIKNLQARPWTPGEEAVLLKHVQAAPTPWQGCAAASAVIGRSTKACYDRYVKLKQKGVASAAESRPHQMLHRLTRVRDRLGVQDLDEVARATGLHYHTVLSILANLHAQGVVSGPCPGCAEAERLRAKAAELENALQAREAEVDALRGEVEELRARVAELESRLGAGIDPLKVELADEIGAGLGACVLRHDYDDGVPLTGQKLEFLMRVAEASKRCARSITAAMAYPEQAQRHIDRARRALALLGACLAWVEGNSVGQSSQPENQKGVC